MAKNTLISPFLKWVGGKRQIMPSIINALPKNHKSLTYVEPFIGGGAVFFHLQPRKAIINDFNGELVNVYYVIKENLEELISDLKKHKNDSEYFYQIRSLDRSADYQKLTNIERASRVIFLNKTCFNGLYRVNNAGEFNAPFGRYKNPNIINEPTLKAVNNYLNSSDIQITCNDYSVVLKEIRKNSFVYLDPPYHPTSASSSFTGYTQGGWDSDDQIRLKQTCDELHAKGIKFLLSNSSTDFVIKLYEQYNISIIKAVRTINSNADKRGEIDEVLVRNYE